MEKEADVKLAEEKRLKDTIEIKEISKHIMNKYLVIM